jgi:hypothetical protein
MFWNGRIDIKITEFLVQMIQLLIIQKSNILATSSIVAVTDNEMVSQRILAQLMGQQRKLIVL